jgi:hypothetical protein
LVAVCGTARADADTEGLWTLPHLYFIKHLWWLVVFMTVIMETIDGSSERIARDANRSITNFICFNL